MCSHSHPDHIGFPFHVQSLLIPTSLPHILLEAHTPRHSCVHQPVLSQCCHSVHKLWTCCVQCCILLQHNIHCCHWHLLGAIICLSCALASLHYTWVQCQLLQSAHSPPHVQIRLTLQLIHFRVETDSCSQIPTSHCSLSTLSQGAHLTCKGRPPKRRSCMLCCQIFSCHRVVTSLPSSGPSCITRRAPQARCGTLESVLQVPMTITSCTIRIF